MFLVISTDRRFLSAAVDNLSRRCSQPVVAVQGVSQALNLVRDNAVEAVVVHERMPGEPMTGALERRFPHLHCVAVAPPTDWDSVAEELVQMTTPPSEQPCVVASGAEELLGLLAMTRRSADIEFTAGRNHGRLIVHDGTIIDAQAGAARGDAAALRILAWDGARVKSRSLVGGNAEASMHRPITQALYEVARRRDELTRLATMPDVDALIGNIAAFDGFAGALLADADNRVALVERGPMDASVSRRLWDGVAMCQDAADSHGIATWNGRGVVVAVPVAAARVLAVAIQRREGLSALRHLVNGSAAALREIVERISTGRDSGTFAAVGR